MTTDVKLLPLFAGLVGHPRLEVIKDYARANVEYHAAKLLAENERLRAEVAEWKASYQQAADAGLAHATRAERLAEVLRWIASDETAAASTIHSGMDEVDAIKVRARAALDQEGGAGK